MVNQKFKYFAFISYSGKDEKWAKWLHTNLEHYHIPTTLCKENPNIPKKIRPVFWYKKDLSGTKLKEALEKELEVSQYLIVICSPDSAKSDWVNDEVKSFIARGRSKYIIPFIVDGVPHSANENNECFPESLRNLPREEEIRGISVQEDGKQHALVDVVATMFGVSFDTLWQRHKRRERNICNLWISICAFMMVCAFGIWDYTRTKVEYYADWVDCNGVAQGIIPLDDEQVNHRYYSYKFEFLRVPFGEKGFYSWRLKRVNIVNSKGVISNYIPDNHDFFYPIQEYLYTDGYVTEIINRDNYNRVVMRYAISDDYNNHTACLYDLAGKDVRQESSYLSASTTAMNFGNNTDNKSKIKRFHYTRNEQGYITKVTYHANDDDNLEESAIGDNNNIYGKIYELDSIGRIIKMSYINNEGNLMTDKLGVGHIKFNYASFGGEETIEYLGNDEKLAYNEQKYARIISKLDTFGNPIEQWHEGIDGEPCFNYKNIYRQIITFDDNGFLIEMKYLDFDGNLAYCSDNYAIQRIESDKKGRYIKVSHYDTNENPCYNKYNTHFFKWKYNSQDCIVEQRCYDISGKPCVDKNNGIHMIQSEYDGDNYEISMKYYDINLNLSISPIHHYAILKITYDNYHNVTKIEYFDEKGAPCFSNEFISSYTKEYDRRGNLIKEEFFDKQGKPCISKFGYAIRAYKYDDYGNLIEECAYGIDQKPVYVNMCSSIQYDYYPNGKVKESRCYNENGNLCLNDNWFAISRFEYDKNGNNVKESYFDADTIPCYIKDGIYSIGSYEYDDQNNIIKTSYFDTQGKAMMSSDGVSIASYKYNKHRQIVEEAYFDVNNRPCLKQQSYHKCINSYNQSGLLESKTFYSTDENRCTYEGAHKIVYEYDEKSNQIKETNYNKREKKCINSSNYCSWIAEYDNIGRITSICYYDTQGKPKMAEIKSKNGGILSIGKMMNKYDLYGNIIERSFYNEKGELTINNGWAKEVHVFDNLNRVIETRYYNEYGDLMGGGNSKPIEKYVYDNLGQVVLFQLLEADNSVYANINMKYEKNNLVEIGFTDKYGKPQIMTIMNINYGQPYAKARFFYDEKGMNVKNAYYNTNGELYDGEMGYAYILNFRDVYGRVIKQELYDKDGNAAETTVGRWSIAINNYDERGNLIEQSYYAKNGELAYTPYGWARRLQTYNEKGQCVKDIYYSFDGSQWRVENIHKGIEEHPINEDKNSKEEPLILLLLRIESFGQMYEKGFQGKYFILEYNNWNMHDGLDTFLNELMRSKDKTKRLVLLPVVENSPIIEYTFSRDPLSARIMDWQQSDGGNETYQKVSQKYNKWKERQQ